MTKSQLVLILQLISGESGANVFLDQSRSEEKQNLRSTSIHNWKFLCGLLDMHHTQTCYALTALKCHELTQKWPWSKTFMKKGNFGRCIYNNNKAEKKQTETTNRNNKQKQLCLKHVPWVEEEESASSTRSQTSNEQFAPAKRNKTKTKDLVFLDD